VVAIVIGVVVLAPEKKKKVNLNRKRSFFEKMWTKLNLLKGA